MRSAICLGAALLLASACSSGPSEAALAANRTPASTTTTAAPPEGVVVVRITNGSFRPSNLKLDLDTAQIVEWRHEDVPEREYLIEATNGEFISETLTPGDVFQVDFSDYGPGIYRYFSMLGQTRLPGLIDTRPDQ